MQHKYPSKIFQAKVGFIEKYEPEVPDIAENRSSNNAGEF